MKFQFLVPDGAGSRNDGGQAVLQWTAGPDPTGAAEFSLYASRGGIAPFGVPQYDVTIDATSRAPIDGIRSWDVSFLAPGCYQPFAEMDDQIEGVTWRPAAGFLTVSAVDGGTLFPALWVLSPANQPISDGGLELSFVVDEPDLASWVSIEWVLADGGSGLVAADLQVRDGGGQSSYRVPAAALPAGESCYLRLKVRTDDGRSCTAWWSGQVRSSGRLDAGTDAGASNAGSPDAGRTTSQPQGCGCAAAPACLALASLLLTARKFGRRRSGSECPRP